MNTAEIKNLNDRVLAQGAEALSDVELLAVVIGSPELARTIYHGQSNWRRIKTRDLRGIPRIRDVRVAQVLSLLELSGRIQAEPVNLGKPINSAQDVTAIYRPRLQTRDREEFVVLALDNKNRILLEHVVAKGTLSNVEVHPREVFKKLIDAGAARAIALHNHPSGDPTPSPADKACCQRLEEVGKLVGIDLLDFIIVAANGSWSFRETGLLVYNR